MTCLLLTGTILREAYQKVFSDYLNILHTVKKKIRKGSQKRDVIEYLEDGRIRYLPLRRQLYAEVKLRWELNAEYIRNLPKFEKGLLGILMGGLSPFATEYKYRTPYHSGHTLLDLIMRLRDAHLFTKEDYEEHKKKLYGDKFTKFDKEVYCGLVDEQIKAIEHAWQDVVDGYAEYKAMVAAKPLRVKKNYKTERTKLQI